jgi:hypothetical protein
MTFPPPSMHGTPHSPQGGPAGPLPPPPSAAAGAPTAYLPRTMPEHSPQQPPQSRLPTVLRLFAAASLAAVVLGISVPEDGHAAWHAVKAWGAVAVIAAALTSAPSFGSVFRLSPYRAWQVAAGGAAGLGLYWVLFVLPDIGKNTSLVTTLGVAAGIVVAWIAPGRQPAGAQPADGPSGARPSAPPSGPTW